MEYVTLGRTGLRASVIGLGTGGPSRLGLATGRSEADAVALIHRALDLGVNVIDTAHAYGTETVVGSALAGGRAAAAIVATKRAAAENGARPTEPMIAESLEASLRRLRTDRLNLFLLHGLLVEDYAYAVAEIVPALRRLRDAGKVRFLGVSKAFGQDRQHEMLGRALADGWWDAIMVGVKHAEPERPARARGVARVAAPPPAMP
jgi:L-galactose dehydrogenase